MTTARLGSHPRRRGPDNGSPAGRLDDIGMPENAIAYDGPIAVIGAPREIATAIPRTPSWRALTSHLLGDTAISSQQRAFQDAIDDPFRRGNRPVNRAS